MWMATLMAASSAVAQAQTFDLNDLRYTFLGCSRASQGTSVDCNFTVVSPGEDRTRYFNNSNSMRIISPTGRERTTNRAFVNESQSAFYNFRAGITYNVRLSFTDFPENTIRYFDFFGRRIENVPVRGSAPTPAPAPVTPAGARTTTALPGQAEWRQRVRLDNTNYMAVVHGCFRATANATTASCLVSLLAENPSGTVGASGNTVLYGATLVQFNGQAITNNTVNLQVGDSLIRAIPVR